MRGSYDIVASFYDRLSKFIFGNAIRESQKFLISAIGEGNKILIVGGGTGWIIEELSAFHKSNLKITYIDISKKMIELAKKRNAYKNKIEFINKSILDVELTGQYDIVITPFFLDNFCDENIEIIIDKINTHLVKNGVWLYSDFSNDDISIWQKTLLKIMYLFFRITCNIEATKLAETKSKFIKRGFKIISSKTFSSNFICSVIYGKT